MCKIGTENVFVFFSALVLNRLFIRKYPITKIHLNLKTIDELCKFNAINSIETNIPILVYVHPSIPLCVEKVSACTELTDEKIKNKQRTELVQPSIVKKTS